MADDARKAINDAVADAEFILTPMYALKPQQRLGYLEEIDKITCIKSGLRKLDKKTVGFQKGEEYDVRVSSATIESWYTKESGASGAAKDMVKLGKALRQEGWNGYSCQACGYHVWTQRVKPMYTCLKHAFDGIVIDEGVKIKSRHSQLGIAGRSLPSGLLQFCLPTPPLY